MKALKLLFLLLPQGIFAQQLGFALEQINGQAIIEAGLTGKGVKVGIIDGGFLGADESVALRHLFENGLVAGYKDYLFPNAGDFSGSKALNDHHGTEVWELIAGINEQKKVQYGLATGATFYLARTDHGGYEKRREEEYAIEAMEWMAEEGVKIINLSLGYNNGYTDKRENYSQVHMDGKTTILTKAVDRISKKYNLLVVVAAGNDGDKRWMVVGSPGDAQSALTVGATKFKVWDDMKYSSKGPQWLPYVKPEISCYASAGTSFSTPIITGLAACLLEKDPTLTGQELKAIIIQSANLSMPNNYIGHGVPDGSKALKIVDGLNVPNNEDNSISKNSLILKLDKPSTYLTVYHKSDWKVLEKKVIRNVKRKIKVKRLKNSDSSTLIWENGNKEVIWKEE